MCTSRAGLCTPAATLSPAIVIGANAPTERPQPRCAVRRSATRKPRTTTSNAAAAPQTPAGVPDRSHAPARPAVGDAPIGPGPAFVPKSVRAGEPDTLGRGDASPDGPLREQTRKTLRWEALRSILTRPALTAGQGSGLVLLVAIQHFGAGPQVKAALAGASFLGLLLAPAAVTIIARRGTRLNHALAIMLGGAAVALAVSGLSPTLGIFVGGVLVGIPLMQATVPLVTAIWEQNVPARSRGRMFGLIASAATAAGVLSGVAIARWLGTDVGRYRPVMVLLAAGVGLAALAALRIPGNPPARGGRNPLARLALLWQHPRFGTISLAWMLLGIGNLITVPLRTEMVASGDFGPAYAPALVLYLTVVIPQGAALVSALWWGPLFDRMDFLHLRLILNGLFVVSILSFFTPSLPLQIVGAVLFGVASGGGLVAWNLWVTKYAPPHRTADYMAVHTFLTGTRGLAAPFLAYALIATWPLQRVTHLGVGIIVLASVLLLVLVRRGDQGAVTPG